MSPSNHLHPFARRLTRGGQLLAVLGLGLVAACSKGSKQLDSDEADGGSSQGGGAGSAGSAGAAAGAAGSTAVDLSDPSNCTMSHTWLGSIDTPNSLVSVGRPVVVSDVDDITNPETLTDGLYHTSSGCAIKGATSDDPRWVAIDLDGVTADRLLLVWNDRGSGDYNSLSGNPPAAYRIEVSSDSSDGSNGTWEVALDAEGNPLEVTENPVRARGHSFGFTGMRWVRFVVTAPSTKSDGTPAPQVSLDEISVFDISASGDERPQDTWFMMGDSIVKMSFAHDAGSDYYFESVVTAELPAYTPAVISGGIGSELASDGVEHVVQWLQLNPDFSHIGINYGTNDSWGKTESSAAAFEGDLRQLVQAVLDAGRIPHISRIPFSDDGNHDAVPAFNDVIDALAQELDLPCGPDLYAAFYEGDPRETLGNDNVHPTRFGKQVLNRTWAESVLPIYGGE